MFHCCFFTTASPCTVVVAFSGFSEDNEPYTEPNRQAYSATVQRLGGRVVTTHNELKAEVTHVVCPPGSCTPKVLAAAVSGVWLVSVQWLEVCNAANRFLPPGGCFT